MADQLPSVPRYCFTVLEPLSLLAGALGPILMRDSFITGQIPSTFPSGLLAPARAVTPTEEIFALQLGSCYFLLLCLSVGVLWTTSELRVVRVYLLGCLAADITHLAASMYMMGYDGTMSPGSWAPVAWGNIGFTGLLFLCRVAYFTGFFELDQTKKKKGA